eukprot:scaffold29380_cov20-Tisochrysis_lutea.AAC.4
MGAHTQHLQRLRAVRHEGGTGGVDLGLEGALIQLRAHGRGTVAFAPGLGHGGVWRGAQHTLLAED